MIYPRLHPERRNRSIRSSRPRFGLSGGARKLSKSSPSRKRPISAPHSSDNILAMLPSRAPVSRSSTLFDTFAAALAATLPIAAWI